ncbi:ATP-dependent DNA helicase [Halorarum salinum]|uniref:ATP-dependent DNA helicase n=1 Tax=Halorarum salinum TaxID=2743089 RepID=A0A7D5QC80_9EURY|nr:ATP-dependent DNA helicase [Halobaculum salinum]QLG63956.1 ATP-dependent DNA helicase [Halobaculum salinum]
MDRVGNALARGQDVLLEGAPGTGKTLSALVPALAHAREHDRTVVITTNVHQQMRQFVEDARAINEAEPIRATVFKGKSSMCHIDVDYQECQTLRDTTRSLVEDRQDREQLERRLEDLTDEMRDGGGGGSDGGGVNGGDAGSAAEARQAVAAELESLEEEIEDATNVCEHYMNNLTADTGEFFSWLFRDVRRPDEVYEYAERQGLCGYELLKEGMEDVELVVCNYHHLLDPTIREQFFRWLDREPEDVITVFDEAHNVEGAAREHASEALTENTLESALSELEETDDSRAEPAENVLRAFTEALRATYDENLGFGERERVGENWFDVSVANEDRRDDLTLAFLDRYEGRGIRAECDLALQLGKRLDEEYEDAYRDGETTTRRECHLLSAAAFVSAWMDGGGELGQHPMVSVRRDAGTDEVYGRAELYTCIPREVTRDLFEEVYGSVLMSATLRPFDVTQDVLGLDSPATLAYELSYPEENRRTYSVSTPALFSSERDDPGTQETVASTLSDAVRFTPGNSLLFFPSYAEAERYHELLSGDPELGTVLLDGSDQDTEDLRTTLVGSDDAALFTSLWGTLAEGVSFDGDAARTVAVVGVPYPHLSERMEAVQDAYDRVFAERSRDAGWEYAVEIPTVRKTRQALGRVIRSPEDFGVRLLLDKRYTSADMGKYSVRGTFPPEEREELIDIRPGKLKFAMLNFYSDHDAYSGSPPEP